MKKLSTLLEKRNIKHPYALIVTFFSCDTCTKNGETICQGHNFFHQPLDHRAAVDHIKSWGRSPAMQSATLVLNNIALEEIRRSIYGGTVQRREL